MQRTVYYQLAVVVKNRIDMPESTIDPSRVSIVVSSDINIFTEVDATKLFGCLKLQGGIIYHIWTIAILVNEKLEKNLCKKIVKVERKLFEVDAAEEHIVNANTMDCLERDSIVSKYSAPSPQVKVFAHVASR